MFQETSDVRRAYRPRGAPKRTSKLAVTFTVSDAAISVSAVLQRDRALLTDWHRKRCGYGCDARRGVSNPPFFVVELVSTYQTHHAPNQLC
jgi:hypothetical protein